MLQRGTKEWHDAILKEQIKLTEETLKIKTKYMWSWLEKYWNYGAFILGKTIFLKKSLTARANQGLVAHDTQHILDKIALGFKYKLKYAFSKKFRAEEEARGYAQSIMIACAQGRSKKVALDTYSYLLATRYRLKITEEEAKKLIEDELFLAEMLYICKIPIRMYEQAVDRVKSANTK